MVILLFFFFFFWTTFVTHSLDDSTPPRKYSVSGQISTPPNEITPAVDVSVLLQTLYVNPVIVCCAQRGDIKRAIVFDTITITTTTPFFSVELSGSAMPSSADWVSGG